MSCNRVTIGTCTMVMLVALRLAIGWHFFKEGVSHKQDRTWTSEGFLRAAKGPLAPQYHAMVDDFHGWDRLLLAPSDDSQASSKDKAKGKAAKAEDKADKSGPEKKPAADEKGDKTAKTKTPAKTVALKVVADDEPAKASDSKPDEDKKPDAKTDDDKKSNDDKKPDEAKKLDGGKQSEEEKPEGQPKAPEPKADQKVDDAKPESKKPEDVKPANKKSDGEKPETPKSEVKPEETTKPETSKPKPPKASAVDSDKKVDTDKKVETTKSPTAAADKKSKTADVAGNTDAKKSAPADDNAGDVDEVWYAWLTAVGQDWKTDAADIADHYHYTVEQRQQAVGELHSANAALKEMLRGIDGDLRLYRKLAFRAQQIGDGQGINEAPFMKARAAAIQKNPLNERGISGAAISTPPPAWMGEAKEIERGLHERLLAIADEKQVNEYGPLPDQSPIHRVDHVVMWTLMIVGGCLIVGLFTRLAAVVGAAFLVSVILSQPPWIADTVPTYNQVVECIALLALATTAVGRWAGLDYFIHTLLIKPCCAAETKKA